MTPYSLTAGRRTSWLPPVPLISAKLLELRKRRTLMIVTVAFTVGLPVIFYGIRLLYHLGDPARYAPAGAPNAFATVGTLMAEFGFIAAAALGATAGTADLTDGMFRHLVITGRSRLALYLARIPAGLSILLSLAAAGFTVTCLVTAFLGSPHAAGAVTVSAGRHGPLPGCGSSSTWSSGSRSGSASARSWASGPCRSSCSSCWRSSSPRYWPDHPLPYFLDGERLIVGVAMDQLKPAALAGGPRSGRAAASCCTYRPCPPGR